MVKKYVTAGDIAETIGGVVWGNPEVKIYEIALPKDSSLNSLTYFEANASLNANKTTEFAACIVPLKYQYCDDRTYIVINKGVYQVLHILIAFLIKRGLYTLSQQESIGRNTYISPLAIIGNNCTVGNNTSIAENVIIGNSCSIGSNVVIEHDVVIGNNVVIQSGAVIGADSFEFAEADGYKKIKNVGSVTIMNNVTIGANSTISRGTIGDTVIGEGTVIDTLVQIGHEVKIGKNCKICSQCGLAGWSVLEDNVVLYGKVGVANNVIVENDAIVLAMSGVSKKIKSKAVVSGVPAINNKEHLKEKLLLRNMVRRS